MAEACLNVVRRPVITSCTTAPQTAMILLAVVYCIIQHWGNEYILL